MTVGIELGTLWTTVADTKIPISLGYAETLTVSGDQEKDYEYFLTIQTPINMFNVFFGY